VKTVNFTYQTELNFSSPASEHRFLLKILPQTDGRQNILRKQAYVEPQGILWYTRDYFGNEAIAGHIEASHTRFCFGVNGTALISEAPYTGAAASEADVEFGAKFHRLLLYPTDLTRPCEKILSFYKELLPQAPPVDGGVLSRALYFSHAVHEYMSYCPGATNSTTTASGAFAGKAGVCQDFAHILLVILRLAQIPCRYVAGLASDYGETHAWAEVFIGEGESGENKSGGIHSSEGKRIHSTEGGFYGIDPTRDKLADENYLVLSRGRDFNDAAIDRGIYKGKGVQTQTVITLNMEVL